MIALACSALLVAFIALPWISKGYGIDRLYAVAITILSVFFVIGGITLSKLFFFLQKTFLLHKSLYAKFTSQKTSAKGKNNMFFGKSFFSKETFMTHGDTHEHENNKVFSYQMFEEENASRIGAYLVILLVLIPYFFCVTGVMYNIFGFPEAIILNSEGGHYDSWYVHDQESYGAKWLRNNGELENTMIYIGRGSWGRLTSQAGIQGCDSYSLFEEGRKIDGYIYLRYYNVIDGKLLDRQREEHNITKYQDKFAGKSRIYNNGGSEVWR